jgi:bifunctional UDP-N-acetylglucosamine pyrophosphorylase / glucosamine-1-phosphate N-acetyltransferase
MSVYSTYHDVGAVILAAGKGSRMNGMATLSKAFLPIAGRSVLDYISDSLSELGIKKQCLVVSKEKNVFEHCRKNYPQIDGICIQESPNGTAAAVASAAPYFGKDPLAYASNKLMLGASTKASYVLICNGDVPFVSSCLLKEFINFSISKKLKFSLIGTKMPEPKGYGRVILDTKGRLKQIIEEKDATPEVLQTNLCNSGIYLAQVDFLFKLLKNIKNDNIQQEYYFTDCVRLAVNSSVGVYISSQWEHLLGINTPKELMQAEAYFLKKTT